MSGKLLLFTRAEDLLDVHIPPHDLSVFLPEVHEGELRSVLGRSLSF
jgi:hypothetical protein